MTEPRQFTPRYRPARLDEPGAILSRYVVLPGDPEERTESAETVQVATSYTEVPQ